GGGRGRPAPGHASRRRGRQVRRPAGSARRGCPHAPAQHQRLALRRRGGRSGRLAGGVLEPLSSRPGRGRLGGARPEVTRRLSLLATLGVAVGMAPRARACPAGWDPAAGPLPGGIGPADFGAVPEACPASEVALRARGTLLVSSAAPDFYGSVAAGAMIRARHEIGPRTW